MAEALIMDATVQVLVEKLLVVAVEEIGLALGVKNELRRLKESLDLIHAFLHDASSRKVEDEAVKLWLKNLEDVAYEADELLDEFSYEIIRRKVEIENRMNRKVCFFFSFSNSLMFRLKIAHKIKDLNTKFETVNEDATRYGLQKRVVDSVVYVPSVMETDSISVGEIVLGREDDVSKIVNMLVVNRSDDEVVSVVPIVGMGGPGKTTLARLVFNDTRTLKHFDERIWVCVCENVDTTLLLKRILEELTPGDVRIKSKEDAMKKLRERLKDRRYLLVLDDLWNDERRFWEDFKSALLGINPNKGNFCLVTTRSEDVASIVNPMVVYPLDKLSNDDCWSIIKAKAFYGGEVPTELETIGMDIALKCGGLPLAATMVGATLQGKKSDDWTSFLNSGLSNSNREASWVLQVLKVSFDRLPSLLIKKCFAYCSIFPKSASLQKELLIQLWMAEGFLIENDGDDMENMGSRVYDLLLQNSFLQEAVNDEFGNIKHSKMHNLVHDLACSISEAESFNVKKNTAKTIPPQVRYMAIESLDEEAHEKLKERAIYLRTLFLRSDEISGRAFKDFRNLHVLNLYMANVIELTNSISKLIHLRFLDVSSNYYMKAFPESICKLLNLQTLRASYCSSLARLPDRFQQLVSLRHLIVRCSGPIDMPREIGRLTCLQTLEFFNVGHKKGFRIAELGFLKNLKGKLVIRNLERVSDKEEASRAGLLENPNLLELVYVWSRSREGNNNDEEVLEGLQPHQNIKSLTIQNYLGDNFPSWTLNMTVGKVFTLNKLTEIKLVDCERSQEIPTLGHLPMLKILELESLKSVKSICYSFYYPHGGNESSNKESNSQPPPFRALKHFGLKYMTNLVEWIEPSGVDAFPNLESFKMVECQNMTIAPSHSFPSLKELRVEGGSILLHKICSSSLISLEIGNVEDLTCIPERLLNDNQRLQVLAIHDCPSLTQIELPDDVHSLRSLEILSIRGCNNLKSIQYSSGDLISLQTLEIRNCRGLTDFPIKMLESCMSLKYLDISECENLASSFPIDCQKMPLLYFLDISRCPKLRSLPKNTDCLRHLRGLSIGPFSREVGLTSFNEALRGIQRLEELQLYGWQQWDSLPDQLQHLTALTSLRLYSFGIEVLPEWFGNFSSLQELNIYDCVRLKHLPSQEAMQRLTHLTAVTIRRSPLLEGMSNPESHLYHSEWPKISHVSRVGVYC